MSFHVTAEDIRLEVSHFLFARLETEDGDFVDSMINLNHFLGNNNGCFEWGGENFADTARGVDLEIQGYNDIPMLHAELSNANGETYTDSVDLAERIENINGSLTFVG